MSPTLHTSSQSPSDELIREVMEVAIRPPPSTQRLDGYLKATTDEESSRTVIQQNLEHIYTSWKSQPISSHYMYVFMQIHAVVIVDDQYGGSNRSASLILTMGISMDGQKHLLDVAVMSCFAEADDQESKNHELEIVFESLQSRGLCGEMMFILPPHESFFAACEKVYPRCLKRLCSLSFRQMMKQGADLEDVQHLDRDFKQIYRAGSDSHNQLIHFMERWGSRYPVMVEIAGEFATHLLSLATSPKKMIQIITTCDIMESLAPQVSNVIMKPDSQICFESKLLLMGLIVLAHYTPPPSWQEEQPGWNQTMKVMLEAYVLAHQERSQAVSIDEYFTDAQ